MLGRADIKAMKVKATAVATATTSVLTLIAGTDFTTGAKVAIYGYGVHLLQGASNPGDVTFVVSAVQVAPSAHMSNFAPKTLVLPINGVPIDATANIVITYTHAASVAIQTWVVYREL